MLNNTSAQIGVNLAVIANDRKMDFTPKAGTLLEALCKPVKQLTDLSACGVSGSEVDDLKHVLVNASSGERATAPHGSNTYNATEHDTLMDSYIVELGHVVGQHVTFARQVVHTKINYLVDAVQTAFAQYPIKEAEDIFDVRFYKQHDLFKSFLIEDEVSRNGPRAPSVADIVNFGDTFNADFDVVGYFATGDSDIDQLIKDWIASVGKDTILSYLAPKSAGFETSLFGPDALNFYMANFLLFRQLAIKQDLNTGLSSLKLMTSSGVNRDYHAGQLALQLGMYDGAVKQGVLLTPDSQTRFSYLSSTKFIITIYEESFAKLEGVDSVMEKIFGAVSRYGAASLSVELINSQGADFLNQWKVVRGLYTSYLVSSRSQLLKSSLKLMLPVTMALDCGEEKDSPVFNEDYLQKSMVLAAEYIDTLQSSDAQDLYKVCMEVIGRIIYRFTNAYFFIREMYEILEQDADIDPQEAAHAASVRYITDFLLEQIDITKKSL